MLEQNYEYDLLNPAKLMDKFVGKEVTLIRLVTENNSTKEVPVKATLLSNNQGPVWKVGNDIVTGMGADRLVFPNLPENLYSKPTLVWLLDNRHTGEQDIEASYLTNDMNWNADYVLTVAADQKAADLNGWVTVVNHSGTAYRNAQLQLVAGEPDELVEGKASHRGEDGEGEEDQVAPQRRAAEIGENQPIRHARFHSGRGRRLRSGSDIGRAPRARHGPLPRCARAARPRLHAA